MKKSLLGILAVGAFALAGCAKTVTKEEAKENAKNYAPATEVKACKAKATGKISKATGIFKDTPAPKDEEKDTKVSPITASYIDSLPENYVIKLDGKKLVLILELKGREALDEFGMADDLPEEVKVDGYAKTTNTYDEKGYIIKAENEMDVSISVDASKLIPGIELNIDGALKASAVTTWTY